VAGLVVLTWLGAVAAHAAPVPGETKGYVDGPWGQIHYRLYGKAGEPTVILLHKMVWSSLEFKNAQPALAALGVRSIAIDLPGYGLSDGPDHEPTAEQYADALLPVLDQLHLGKVDVMGIHTGASLAVVFGVRHPDRVRRMIVQGPPLFDANLLHTLITLPLTDHGAKPGGQAFTDRWRWTEANVGKGSESDAALQESVMDFYMAKPHDEYAHNAVFKYDLPAGIKSLTEPVLLLTGTHDPLYGEVQKARKLRPDFAYAEIDWRGSEDVFDDPNAWAGAVAAYLKAPGP
jgi:pimeloyl-ACP methyl ester carboxylesterase